jgi:ABC-type lipoprotein release transport system permease subunit
MITRSGLKLAGVGMAVGLPLAWLMARAVASALNIFGTSAGLIQATGVVAALALVALFSTWLPARRASGVLPASALRE